MLSCRVTQHYPSVAVELAYADKWTAENVVANFHNQKVSKQGAFERLDAYADTCPGRRSKLIDGLEGYNSRSKFLRCLA